MEDKLAKSPFDDPLAKSPLRMDSEKRRLPTADSEMRVRYAALELAVQTVRNMSGFSDAQVIRTAARYEKYITTGEIPVQPQPVAADPRGDSDGPV